MKIFALRRAYLPSATGLQHQGKLHGKQTGTTGTAKPIKCRENGNEPQ